MIPKIYKKIIYKIIMTDKKKKLVIVESPAKCKKIESILGKEYICKASYGHIKKLKKVLIDQDFKPIYELDNSIPIKVQNTKELIKKAKECSEVIIASDLDREGEAIGYDLIEVLGLNPKSTKRIVFNEITKSSVIHAINNPRTIDMHLYHARETRVILDQIIGYQLSPILWKYICKGISAGRVQSPALKILCERENKINSFIPESFYKVNGDFKLDSNIIKSVLNENIEDKEKSLQFLEICQDSIFKVEDIKNSESSRSPPQPFITSTLQQEASKVYGINPKSCMQCAQKLYESGLITYMRTDSVQLSEKAMTDIKNFILDKYTDKYYSHREFKNKSTNTQEAHEAIRPVDINKINVDDIIDDSYTSKLYTLIWKRTVACQMKPMKINVNKILISISKSPKYKFISTINRILFDGYTKVYKNEDSEIDTEQNLLDIKMLEINQIINYQEIVAKQDYTRPSPRLNEADLIKDLEKKGIGRPSTYSGIIDTIVNVRNYAEKKNNSGETQTIDLIILDKNKVISQKQEDKVFDAFKGKLVVTDIGKSVNKFLTENFNSTINYSFTSDMEKKLDLIASGKLEWKQTLEDFYNIFSPTVNKLNEKKIDTDDNDQDSRRRLLGELNNRKIYVTFTKKGLNIAEEDINKNSKKKYSRFASVPSNYKYDDITLEQAKSLLIYPLLLGTFEGKNIIVNKGPYGLYFTYNTKNYSLKNLEKDVENITLENVIEIIKNNSNDTKNDVIKEFSKNITLKKGKVVNEKQLSSYLQVKQGKSTIFIPIPKDIEEKNLTIEKVNEIIENYKKPKKITKKK